MERKKANVKNWASILDDNTRLQAEMLSRSGVVWGHVALMPDAHLGQGATVGSVIATKEAVIPAAVGVDIGCGMCAVETSLTRQDLPDDLTPLHEQIARAVRSGWGARGQLEVGSDRAWEWLIANLPTEGIVKSGLLERAARQLGTLGSGNHFIEVCVETPGQNDALWVVLHSGSRGVGNNVATGHIKVAVDECRAEGISLEDPDLAYLLEGTATFDAYIADMNWCQEYARANRDIMMDVVLDQLFQFAGVGYVISRINCHHNFTQREVHFGETVWITRKGAIFAGEGVPGIVPGSMATATYITTGLGNTDSYLSSAHGGGRQMSRGQAKRALPLDGVGGLHELMQGVAWNEAEAQTLLDEHPMAYKDIEIVMHDQRDLCVPIRRLKQILNYKGA